jgi:hypothetical protein
MVYGLIEVNANGQQILGHRGDLIYSHSASFFNPKENFGLFIAVSIGGTAAGVTYQLVSALLDHFFPSPTGRASCKI